MLQLVLQGSLGPNICTKIMGDHCINTLILEIIFIISPQEHKKHPLRALGEFIRSIWASRFELIQANMISSGTYDDTNNIINDTMLSLYTLYDVF